MDTQFNPNEWQGKKQNQVEDSYKFFWWSFLGLLLILFVLMVLK